MYLRQSSSFFEPFQKVQKDGFFERHKQLSQLKQVGTLREVWKAHLTSAEKLKFFYHAVLLSIKSYRDREYTAFDAHTTSNCCHGIALLVRDLVFSCSDLDLDTIEGMSRKKIYDLQEGSSCNDYFIDWVPEQMIMLTTLYILGIVREIDSQKRMRTNVHKLRAISHVGIEFGWTILGVLKKHLSNFVALSYQLYGNEIDPSVDLHGVSINLWRSYVESFHIRIDKKGIHYASCIFSTQIVIAYLTFLGGKIAVINDIIDSDGELRDRYICVLQGDGYQSLKPLSLEEVLRSDEAEPVIVFGGYVCSDTWTYEDISKKMDPWLRCFPKLMLSCDLFYPQFPLVRDDPNFNNCPIFPEEASLRKALIDLSFSKGVSISDPSLFCSSHTYTASMGQILQAITKKGNSLPVCFHGLGLQFLLIEPWIELLKAHLS